jgi:hypothetical protein
MQYFQFFFYNFTVTSTPHEFPWSSRSAETAQETPEPGGAPLPAPAATEQA